MDNYNKEGILSILSYYNIPQEFTIRLIERLDDTTLYTGIEDRQGGQFGLHTETKLGWLHIALSWLYTDETLEELTAEEIMEFLETAFTAENIIPYIDDFWEITIVETAKIMD